jgi:hypothetical protein
MARTVRSSVAPACDSTSAAPETELEQGAGKKGRLEMRGARWRCAVRLSWRRAPRCDGSVRDAAPRPLDDSPRGRPALAAAGSPARSRAGCQLYWMRLTATSFRLGSGVDFEHVDRVRRLALRLARESGISAPRDLEVVEVAALLHDVQVSAASARAVRRGRVSPLGALAACGPRGRRRRHRRCRHRRRYCCRLV